MSSSRAVVVAVLAAVLALVSPASAQSSKPPTKISQDLARLHAQHAAASAAGVPLRLPRSPLQAGGDWVIIDAIAAGDPAVLAADLVALGAQNVAIARRLVSARFPIAAIPALNGVVSLRFARASYRRTNAGAVISQGDAAMRADVARSTFGFDGRGVIVGVLSDSYNCQGGAPSDVISLDLPPVVTVLVDSCGPEASGTDEGRAMLQIVHDVAPGAALAFATADGGEAAFANNIRALRDAGATVIVDDVIYPTEPMFQDGVIAQAVDEVVASGMAFFSAAGNYARHAYASSFVPGQTLPDGFFPAVDELDDHFRGGTVHLFGPGNFKQRVTVPPGGIVGLLLQWDTPFGSLGGNTSATNDLDLYVLAFDPDLKQDVIIGSSSTDSIAAGDPVESLGGQCPFGGPTCVLSFVIVNHAGPNPGRFKYVVFDLSPGVTFSPALNAGTIYGHANAAGAVAVGAVDYRRTPAFGVNPPVLESFSSSGTTPILFDTAGNRLATPDPRQFKPEITAPDGGNTTFFGVDIAGDQDVFPNFFGTSAAAPHAAGVAALLRQAQPALAPADVRTALETTALNMAAAGFDNDTGFGFIRADAAVASLHTITFTTVTLSPTAVNSAGMVFLHASATDSFGHALTYAWTAACGGLTSSGAVDDPASTSPTWRAPVNVTGSDKTCTLKVTASDGHQLTRSESALVLVRSAPKLTSFAPLAGPVGTLVTISGTHLGIGPVTVTFGGNVTVLATVINVGAVQVHVPAGAVTGPLVLTNTDGSSTSAGVFKVAPKITGFSPPSAVAGSSMVVTLTGLNLRAATGATVVKIGALTLPFAAVLTNTSSTIEFTVPLAAVTGKVSVATIDGSATSATDLLVIHPPKVTSFAPAAAPVGATITVIGANLTGATAVTFAGPVTVTPTAVLATSVKVAVPLGAVTGPVSVTNAAGTGTSAAAFKVQPKITGFSPDSVVAGHTDFITVTGTNLKAASGPLVIKVGAFPVPTPTVPTPTASVVVFSLPPGATTGKISITTIDGTTTSATNLTVIQPPKVTSFSPPAAPVGAVITVNGANLIGVSTVNFTGPVSVSATAVVASSLKVIVPPFAMTGSIAVVNPAGIATSTAVFKVQPRITGFTPASGIAGSSVTINGFNLQVGNTSPIVKIGVVPAVVTSATSVTVTATIPPTASTGKISVTTVDGTAQSAANFTVITPPRPTAITPSAAAVGSEVTITGTGLTGVTAVTFTAALGFVDPALPVGGSVGAQIISVTDTVVKAVVPPGATFGQVAVFNAAGGAPLLKLFTALPSITGFTPASGAARDPITVSGFNLGPDVRVGAAVATVLDWSYSEVTFLIPSTAVTAKISVGTAVSANNLVVTTPRVPDLAVLAVTAPMVAVASTPTSVRSIPVVTTVGNFGPTVSTPSSLAVLIGPTAGFTGSTRVLARTAIPAVIPGATTRIATSAPLPIDLPNAEYQVAVFIDPDRTLAELDELNNLNQAPNDTVIVPSVAGVYPLRGDAVLSCGVFPISRVQSQTVSGTLTVTQTGMTVAGTLSGLEADDPVFLSGSATFTGQVDRDGKLAGTITLSVTGAAFRDGNETLPLFGVFADGVLELDAGEPVVGSCSGGIIVTGAPPTALKLGFVTRAQPGAFDANPLVPALSLTGPLAPSEWVARLNVNFETGIVGRDDAVRFTGPAGSGLADAPATFDFLSDSEHTVRLDSPAVTSPAFPPGGAWQVVYQVPRSFSVPSPQGSTRLVFPVPSVTFVHDDFLSKVSWVYRNGANASVAPPAFLRSVRVVIDDASGSPVFDSGLLPPATMAVNIFDDVQWRCVARVVVIYVDDLGNTYEVSYPHPTEFCPIVLSRPSHATRESASAPP
jgi:hypothetical protein